MIRANPIREIALVSALLATVACSGGANIAYREGHAAESHKDWDTALVDYGKAKQSDPANSLYILHEQNARTHAALVHLDNGHRLLKTGQLDEAAGELQKAARIDPSNRAASQELEQLLAKETEAKKSHTEAIQNALKSREEAEQRMALKLQPFPLEPLAHFHINADNRRGNYARYGKRGIASSDI